MNWAFYESYNQLVKWLVGWNESVFGSFLTQFWWVNWLGIGGLVVMKRIFGIRVRGTKIRIRRESKVRFGFVLFCSSFRVSTCVRLKLLTCFVFFFFDFLTEVVFKVHHFPIIDLFINYIYFFLLDITCNICCEWQGTW